MSYAGLGAFLSWVDDTGSPVAVYWDCVVKENASYIAHVTRHPVEAGVAITDHVRPQPKSFSLQGYISQTPIRSGNVLMAPTGYVLNIVDPPSSIPLLGTTLALRNSQGQISGQSASLNVQPLSAQTQTDLVTLMIELLQNLQDAAQLVTIVAPNHSYDNMLIESFEVSGAAEYGTGRMFDVKLTEIRTVQSLTTQAPVPAIPQVQQKQATGDQPSAPTNLISSPAKILDFLQGKFQ